MKPFVELRRYLAPLTSWIPAWGVDGPPLEPTRIASPDRPPLSERLAIRWSVPEDTAERQGDLRVGRELPGSDGVLRAHLARLPGSPLLYRLERLGEELRSDAIARRTFDETSRTLQQLVHPHVARVTELGFFGREPYRLVEQPIGLPLDELARQSSGPLPPSLVLTVGVRALEVLQHAHDRRDHHDQPILHGHFSPKSVVLVPGGDLKVVGFGVIAPVQPVPVARVRALHGSLRWLAPEQRRGRPLDVRTDVYAAARVILDLLTGPEALDADPFAPPTHPRPTTRLRALPGPILTVLARALSLDPADRFPSAAELRRALESAAGRQARMRAKAMDQALYQT